MKKITVEEFIERARKIHINPLYDYSKTNYVNYLTKVIIICPDHGEFYITPGHHLSGKRCIKCHRKAVTFDTTKFIEKAKKYHGDLYDYSESHYIANYKKIKIKCKIHGFFEQKAVAHYTHGCKKCSLNCNRKSQEQFIKECIEVHGSRYDYSKVKYINWITNVEIICKIHGSFLQSPAYHKIGRNCQKCAIHGICSSKKERKWLKEMNIPEKYQQYTLKYNGKKFIVDGFDPFTNTIYEFHGDYWHGNPNIYSHDKINPSNKISFGELYKRTMERESLLRSLGYRVIVKWESDI